MASNCPKILAILPGIVPSTIMDVLQPMVDLQRKKSIHFRVVLEYLANKKDLNWADLVIFCRNVEPKYHRTLDFLRARGTPYIYDLDDNFFEIPTDTELGRYHRAPERLNMLTDYLQGASLVRVYSPPLLEQCETINPQTIKVVAPIDWRLISSPAREQNQTVKIVYVTSRVDDRLAEIFMPAVENVCRDDGDRVAFYFWGTPPGSLGNKSFIRFLSPIASYKKFLRIFSRQGFDIGLAPLLDDRFHQSKTNNKFREYAACQIAGIYSDVDVYRSCVVDGETGLLTENSTAGWEAALRRLIDDRSLRLRIQTGAQQYAKSHYSQDLFASTWGDHIQTALQTKSPKATASPVSPSTSRLSPGEPLAGSLPAVGLPRKVLNTLARLKREGGSAAYFRMLAFNLWSVFKINFFKTF